MPELAQAAGHARPAADAARPARRRIRPGPVLVAPLIAGLAITALYPALYTLALSLTRSTLGRPFMAWLGGAPYARLLAGDYATELLRTVLFVAPTAAVQMALGLGLAVLLQHVVRGGGLVRSLILLPVMTPPVMVGIGWKLLLTTQGGWINGLLTRAGLSAPIPFLADPDWAWVSLAVADTWQWTPFVALLCYAALQSLPHEPREAAMLDGAGPWQIFRHVTLPLVAPALVAVLLLRLVIGFKVFDLLVVLTFGGPGDATSFASFRIWRTAFQSYDVGSAAAMTLLLGLAVGLVTLPVSWWHRRVARGMA